MSGTKCQNEMVSEIVLVKKGSVSKGDMKLKGFSEEERDGGKEGRVVKIGFLSRRGNQKSVVMPRSLTAMMRWRKHLECIKGIVW